MSNKYVQFNAEVLFTKDAITTVDRSDITTLKRVASHTPRQRSRLCTHPNSDDLLHEMLIVHPRGTYVRPHKHRGKSESTHIMEGLVDVVLFDDTGSIAQVIRMGDYASGRTFYYRLATPVFHMLLIRSDVLVFHETTNGPFNRAETEFAAWSPEEADTPSTVAYMARVSQLTGTA